MAQTPRSDAMQSEAIVESCSKLMKQLEEFNKALVGSMQEASESNWDLAARLARCHDPVEASRVCEDWMGSQRTMMVNEGRRFADLMFKFYDPEIMMPAIRGIREAREAMTPDRSRSSAAAE
jgi:hypothetical protein